MSKKNLQQLIAEHAALDAQIAALRSSIVTEIRHCIEKFDLTAHELGLIRTQQIPPNGKTHPTFPPKVKGGRRPPRYRDPSTGKTWSGYGHEPGWMAGHRDEYLIKGD
jgi:DNA-binding protein H-NS